MSAALDRILTTPLKATERGGMSSIRVAADSFHVATISAGMNDPAEYARLFAAAPELYVLAKSIAPQTHMRFPENPQLEALVNGWIDCARSAMAKARGEA